MAAFRLSRLADSDLMGIGAYTLRTWGEDPDPILLSLLTGSN